MIYVYPEAFWDTLEDLNISLPEWENLESLLCNKELKILEVIIVQQTKVEYKLFFKEMCKKLHSKGKLPDKYIKYI